MTITEIIQLAKRRATKRLHKLGFYKVTYHPVWYTHGIVVMGNEDDIDIDTTDFVRSPVSGYLNYYENHINICLT